MAAGSQGAHPRRGRPPLLTLDRLVNAAARTDPATLTMAAVAADLGVSTSALYRWVADREALLDLVSITIVERILPDYAATASNWRQWLNTWAENVRREFGAVPGFAARVLAGTHREVAHQRLHAAGVQAYLAAGADPELAARCWSAFSIAVLGWAAAEHAAAPAPDTSGSFDTLLQVLLDGSCAQLTQRRS